MPSARSARRALAAAALALAACAGTQEPTAILGLQSAQQAALTACRDRLQAKACAGREDQAACWDELAAAYGRIGEDGARRQFLIGRGCPSPRVDAWLPDAR
jgi:hypothetical protein